MAFPGDKLPDDLSHGPVPPPVEEAFDHMMHHGADHGTTSSMMHTTMNPMSATSGELVYIRTVTAILMTICVAMINMAIGAAMGKV